MVENTNGGGKQPPRKSFLYYYGLVMLVVMLLNIFLFPSMMDRTQEVRFDQFSEQLKENNVDEVYVTTNNEIVYTLKNDDKNKTWNVTYKTGEIPGVNLYELLDGKDVKYSAEINTQASPLLNFLLTWILPLILFVGIGQLMGRSLMKRMGGGPGNAMTFGKSNAKIYAESETGITFADVAGEEEAKDALKEIVDFLHKPEKYSEIGAVLPKGALLVGPPGTGKTMLAKAVAGEAHVPFFSISGSEFVEMFVGMGAAKVRDLFKQANEKAPCIVFIDEIDTIGKKRDGAGMGGNDEREQTLNQLLTEMDGFDGKKGVVILAATNRPESLDPALLRPGRFDRRIIVDKPDLKGRVQILKVHSKDVKLDETVDFEEIALATSGAVGADLANMMNEAAITAVKNGRKAVSQKDLFEAVELVLVGKEKKDRILSQEERQIVSYHEVGHALVSALQKDSEPVQKITIVPRTMGALGYVMQVPEEEKYLNTEKEIRAMLVGFLGGRAAEEIVFDTVTTGASNDIEKATRIARAMVTQYGMSKKFGLMGLESQENQYLNGRTVLNCSDMTAAEIDQEVMHILKVSYEEAKRLLSENREALDKIAAFLIEKETITGKEFMKIFHEVKGIPELEEKKQEGEDRIEMPEAAKTGDEVQPVKTAEETNAENSQNQQKLEGKPADEAPADETPESAEAVASESPNEDEMRGGSSFDRK